MPLQFPGIVDSSIQMPNLVGIAQENEKKFQLDSAMEYMQTGKYSDNRSYIAKSLSKDKKFNIGSQQDAMNTIQKHNPKMFNDINDRVSKRETALAGFQDKGKDEAVNLYKAARKIVDPDARKQFVNEQMPQLLNRSSNGDRQFMQSGMQKVSQMDLSDKGLDQMLSVMAPEEVGGSMFERLLARGDYTDDQKKSLEAQYVNKQVKSGGGLSVAIGDKGEVFLTEGGEDTAADMMTATHKSKARSEYVNQRIASRKFVGLSNRVLESVMENPQQLGVTGFMGRFTDEVESVVSNLGGDFSEVSKNIEDYDFGSLAEESAAYKTNTLQLALIFAAASGLGQGRALTDKDLQRSITSVGADTNSPKQLGARLKTIQDQLNETLKITAEERGYEHKDLFSKESEDEDMRAIPEGVDESVWGRMSNEDKEGYYAAQD